MENYPFKESKLVGDSFFPLNHDCERKRKIEKFVKSLDMFVRRIEVKIRQKKTKKNYISKSMTLRQTNIAIAGKKKLESTYVVGGFPGIAMESLEGHLFGKLPDLELFQKYVPPSFTPRNEAINNIYYI